MNFLEKFNEIDTFIFDVDGVFTNNELLVMEDGMLLRTMNVKDGYAVRHAIDQGYKVAIITGGGSKGVVERFLNLGLDVDDIHFDVHNKKTVYEKYIQDNYIDPNGILYMGDDLTDYEVMRVVGLPTCPKDAAVEIIEISQYISPIVGGRGCVRDVIEKVLRLHERWHPSSAFFREDAQNKRDLF